MRKNSSIFSVFAVSLLLSAFSLAFTTGCDGDEPISVFVATDNSGKTITSLDLNDYNGVITINLKSSAPWFVTDKPNWISMPMEGIGSGAVSIKAINNTGTERKGVIRLVTLAGGQINLNITQKAFTSLIPGALTFSSLGGVQFIQVIANTTWSITGLGSAGWLTMEPSAGNGNTTIKVTAQPNSSETQEQIAILTYTEQGREAKSLVIAQEKGTATSPVTPELNVYPSSLNFSGNGETKDIIVMSNTVWAVSSSQTWLRISPTAGNGTQIISVTAEENSSASATRTAVLSFTSPEIATPVDIQITQNQGAAKLIINPKQVTFGYLGGRETIEITSNASYTITPWGGTWATGYSSPGFAGTTTINLEAPLNPSDQARTMTLQVTLFGGAMSETITIYQEKNPAKKADPYGGAVVESIDYLDYGWDYSWNEMKDLRTKIEETFTDNINLWPSDLKSAYQAFGATIGLSLFAMKEYRTQLISNEIIYEYTKSWVPAGTTLTVRLDDITEMGVSQTITASVEAKASVAIASVSGSISYASARTVTTTKGIGSDYSWDLREYEQNKEYKVVLVGAYKVCKYEGYIYADGVPFSEVFHYSVPFIKVDENSLRILLISRDL